MNCIRAVTVYCSSSSKVHESYFAAARELGRAIALQQWDLVYGGNDCGLMGALAQATRAAGGKVVGITPQTLVDKGIADTQAHELIVTHGMRERKALLEARADAFITLPGGFGTFEEIFEIIVGRQLGYHQKPIVILNIDGYYEPLLAMILHGVEQRFIKPGACEAYSVFETVMAAVEYLQSFPASVMAPPVPAEPSALE